MSEIKSGVYCPPPPEHPEVSAEPVAWERIHPDGTGTGELLVNSRIEDCRKNSGAWRPLFYAPQSDADKRDAERYRAIAIAAMCCKSIKFNEGGPVYDAAGAVMDSFDSEAVVVAGSGQRFVAESIEQALLEMYTAEFEPENSAAQKGTGHE